MERYRPTVVSVVYQRTPGRPKDLRYAMVQKPLWDADEWGLVQGVFETDRDKTFRDTARREPREELGTLLIGRVLDTGIHVQRKFSQKTLERYPHQGYVGKEVFYFGIEFLGTEEDIHLNAELSRFRFVGKDELLRTIKYAGEVPPILTIIEQEILHGDTPGSIYVSGIHPNTRYRREIQIPVGK